jgi:protein-serine/threonine kinase
VQLTAAEFACEVEAMQRFFGGPPAPAPQERGGGQVVLDDFELMKVIGKGSYGKVMLVKKKGDTEVYAMKMLRKDNVVKRNQVEHTKAERNVLETATHPFIVEMKYAFQTPKKLYFVLEFCSGGELFFHLSRAGRFSEGRTKFYSGEILLALDYLHSLNIIYRDLKPENILLSAVGHAKLTDFGLSKEGIDDNFSAKTMCGTPEYLAPEILDKRGHGKAVDWYSLGALTYEMLSGLPPYYTKDREKLFDRIRRGDLTYPSHITPVAKDMLMKMLLRDPEKRMTGPMAMHHQFFTGINFVDLRALRVQPPFAPQAAGGGDLKYVDKEFLDMNVANSEVGQARGPCDKHFDGFSYAGDS